MKILPFLLFSILGITVVSGIIAPGRGGGGGFSSSSEEGGHGGHGHGHGHHHHGRPPRPPPHDDDDDWPPPRPPPASRRCENGWMTFDRPQGRWCIKVFYGPNTQFAAEDMCQNLGATLTGYQDANERIQVANEARILNNQNGGGLSDVWVGARRKANCPYRESCAPLDTFEWTDGHTTGIGGIQWGAQEPNGVIFPNSYSNMPWGQQNCMELHVSVADGVLARYGYNHGDLDDQHCQQTDKLYACGKTPS